MNKKSFSLLELIFAIVLLSIVIITIIPKNNTSKLQIATDKIILYLNYIRYIAFIDDKEHIDDNEWERKRWSLKFQKCSKKQDGIYFVVFSDISGGTSHFKKAETMKDPLNQKQLYVQSDCNPKEDESKNVLLTKEFGIKDIKVSCNNTSTIGQIAFGKDGKVYSRLGENIKQIDKQCIIKLFDNNNNFTQIAIEANTGYIHKL